jgi:DNA-binding winged helix-turn-helix (wHTH) protein
VTPGSFRFDRFVLDPVDRRLTRDGAPVELNARYLDALALLVAEAGRLVSKERFHDEVWRGVPVTDEALTQCIRTIRRQLGDDAVRPRFIETVPKHGYRFIAALDRTAPAPGAPAPTTPAVFRTTMAGLIGGAVAGVLGGLIYGWIAAAQPAQPGLGAVSVLLVLTCVTALMGVIGGAAVALGIALADRFQPTRPLARIAGGALGGLLIGAAVKLIGLDAFTLLLGASPGDITGAPEGLVLGAAVGLAATRRSPVLAALIGAAAGLAIALTGGRLMAGSLALLAQHFPGSRLSLGPLNGLGPLAHAATAMLEGLIFTLCVTAALARYAARPRA